MKQILIKYLSGRKKILLSLAALLVSAMTFKAVYSSDAHSWPISDHYDGVRFFNPWLEGRRNDFRGFLKWTANRQPGEWRDWTEAPPGQKPPARREGERMRATFVGHSTVLIQTGGLNFITDPIWSERASPVEFAGPKRVRPPGIRFDDLPKIDVVLLSHNHYDHMDISTLKRLHERFAPRVITGLANSKTLAKHGITGGIDLDWWQSVEITPEIRVWAVPAQHFSQRGLSDRNKTLWVGFVVETPAGKFYFAGDTGFAPFFKEIRERFGPMRFSILPIGAFKPEWFMAPMHISPAQAVEVHKLLDSQTSMGVHYGTFKLGDDGQFEPLEYLSRALEESGIPKSRFWALGFGEGREIPSN